MFDDCCPCRGSTLDRLLRPAVLSCVAEESQHGYQIAKRLEALRIFKGAPPDLAGLYRCLRDLENQGLVAGEWDTPAGGKARRRFSITRDGVDCVRQWGSTLADYAAGIEDLRGRLRTVIGKRKR
jgi:DNA-binding PadR family transcriptional regulator